MFEAGLSFLQQMAIVFKENHLALGNCDGLSSVLVAAVLTGSDL